MIVAVHQPNFLPWLGYFNKMLQSDCFIFLDDVQYIRRSVITRTRIKTPNGAHWLTVPVSTGKSSRIPIREVHLATPTEAWIHKHTETIRYNYGKSPWYTEINDQILKPTYEKAQQNPEMPLADWNISLIMAIRNYLNIPSRIELASSFDSPNTSTRRIIDLVQQVGGTTYLSGEGGDKYQDPQLFEQAGISLEYSRYARPGYPQQYGEFEEGLSVLDCLFMCGPQTREYLQPSPTLSPA